MPFSAISYLVNTSKEALNILLFPYCGGDSFIQVYCVQDIAK